MNPEETPKRIDSQKFFKSSKSRFGFGPGRLRYGRVRTISGIVPKRPIPDELVSKISQSSTTQEEESVASPSKKVVSSLGRLTLDLVQINDNLDRIKEVIAEDYSQTKEKNKKEIEDYRKRIANRQRKLPKKDLGDDKSSLKDIIKPFVGSFFSGVGGAIRSLAAFNLMEALLNGDYMQVFKSLMGIGITFIPQIGTMIAGVVLKSLLKGFGRGMMGGGRMPMGRPGRMMGGGPGIGKFGAMMALGTGALALGSAFTSSQDTGGEDQTRLEELTSEQKALTSDGLGTIAQEDLKKFQDLNKKFESILDSMMGKGPKVGSPGTKGDASGSEISDQEVDMNKDIRGSVQGQQFNNAELVSLAKRVGATDEEAVRLAAIAKYESGGRSGAHNDNPSTGDNSYGLWQINMIGNMGPERRRQFGISSNDELFDPVTNAQAALQVLRSSGWGAWSTNSSVTQRDLQEGRSSLSAPPPTPPARPVSPRRTGDEVSATPGSSRGVLVSLVPTPTGSDSPGSANNNGTVGNDSVDPTNRDDTVGILYRTQMNIMEVG